MKRRNADIGKMRRPMKKSKITDGICGSILPPSTVLYVKFITLWVLVILADFILEFRFEFLWPFYLLLRSVYDSFKYQGLAFSLFFVCIALTSDMLCFFFIPVHWLFFAASTYVWVQYVWHTDKGICAPTVALWILFVYIEAAIRLKDLKHMPGHLDLCRPFAAHCIGYPVVTLGFGFKSYVGYRIRQRKQRDVAKENVFYMELMQQALPAEAQVPSVQGDTTSTAVVPAVQTVSTVVVQKSVQNISNRQSNEKNGHIPNGTVSNGVNHSSHGTNNKWHSKKSMEKCKEIANVDHNDQKQHTEKHSDKQRVQNHSHSNGTTLGAGAYDHQHHNHHNNTSSESQNHKDDHQKQHHSVTSNSNNNNNVTANVTSRRREKKEQDKEREAQEYLQKLETDARKLRADLQISRASEQELRLQVAALTTAEKVQKGEITCLQRELEEAQQKVQSVCSSRAADRQMIGNLERKIADERKLRSTLETQLYQEKKMRKQDEAKAAQVAALSVQRNSECTESCRLRRRELETELSEGRSAKHWAEDRLAGVERENATLMERLRETDLLMSALSAMQEKTSHLENSLSAENRIKLDLFSALGEAKRQVEIRDSLTKAQEREIEELKSKIAQVLAVMPNDSFGSPPSATNAISRVRLADTPGSTLDPNATAYTPKGSLIASTEA